MFSRLRTVLHHLNHSKALTASTPLRSASSMSGQQQQHSAACCSVPPVIAEDYKEKGQYKNYAGLKTYFTGPTDTGRAIVIIFDIFGFFPQTMQGADMMASSTNSLVIMPDFFKGKPMDLSVYPPKSDDDRKAIQNFTKTTGNSEERLKELNIILEALKKDGAKKVGVMGFCWGGKIATLAGASGHVDAVGSIHPGMITADDAKELKVPIAMFISPDENQEESEKFMNALSSKPFASKNDYKLYSSMFHGWASARADLKDEENKNQFEDVYSRLATFFNANLDG